MLNSIITGKKCIKIYFWITLSYSLPSVHIISLLGYLKTKVQQMHLRTKIFYELLDRKSPMYINETEDDIKQPE